MTNEFIEWQREHPNFITPDLLKYDKMGNYVVELSEGRGFTNKPIFGVTLLEKEDDHFKSFGRGFSQPFHDKRMALDYFDKLSSSLEKCHHIDDKDAFEECMDRRLEEED